MCVDMARGLAYMHSIHPSPIVHRDLKPGGIYVLKLFCTRCLHSFIRLSFSLFCLKKFKFCAELVFNCNNGLDGSLLVMSQPVFQFCYFDWTGNILISGSTFKGRYSI